MALSMNANWAFAEVANRMNRPTLAGGGRPAAALTRLRHWKFNENIYSIFYEKSDSSIHITLTPVVHFLKVTL